MKDPAELLAGNELHASRFTAGDLYVRHHPDVAAAAPGSDVHGFRL